MIFIFPKQSGIFFYDKNICKIRLLELASTKKDYQWRKGFSTNAECMTMIIFYLKNVYLYYTYIILKVKGENQLNIKNEIATATFMSLSAYFIINMCLFFLPIGVSGLERVIDLNILGYFLILLRDIVSFFSTTLWTLYSAFTKLEGVNYHNDERVKMKEDIVTLDILMNHSLPYLHFK